MMSAGLHSTWQSQSCPTPVRIAINGRFLTQSITGVQRYGHELLRAMDDILPEHPHVEVIVICPKLNKTAPTFRNIALLEAGTLQGHAWEQLELPLLARGYLLFCPGNTAPIISLLTRSRVAVCVHDLSYLYFPDAYSRTFKAVYNVLIPLIFRNASAVITVSESERRAIMTRYPAVAPKLTAIQNGGLPAWLTGSPPSCGRSDKYVLYVGSLSKRKNFPRMLDVAIRLARSRGLRFVFIGTVPAGLSGSSDAVPPDVSGHIEFLGQINDTKTLVEYFRGALCLMFPSLYEASPLPPIEAMACGCPVVSSDIPSMRERCGEAAVYCNPESTDDIANCIERLIDSPSLVLKLQESGLARADVFTWRETAVRTLSVLASAA